MVIDIITIKLILLILQPKLPSHVQNMVIGLQNQSIIILDMMATLADVRNVALKELDYL